MSGQSGKIATFYSYKGGTGRSMALANFAWILASSGATVLVIDWDLEAPGLHRYFRPFLVDPELFETDGLIDMFWTLAASALQVAASNTKERAAVRTDGSEVAVADIADAIEDATRQLDVDFPAGGSIDFVGAGRQGSTYSERVTTFDWKRFYELGGATLLNSAKHHLRENYDWTLIDSRTGVSDSSGICTIQMPDLLVPCFTMNRQSIDGVASILRSIRQFRGPGAEGVDGSSITFYPTAMRIENAEQRRLEVARTYARKQLREFLPTTGVSEREYWDSMEIAYKPAYAFEEVLAAFGDTTGSAGAKDTMASYMEAMAQRITGDQNQRLRLPEILEEDRTRILARYALGPAPLDGSATAVALERSRPGGTSSATRTIGDFIDTSSDSLDVPVADDRKSDTIFLRQVRAKEQRWRASDYYWRELLSRREVDLLTPGDIAEFGRNMSYYHAQSVRMHALLGLLPMLFIAVGALALIVGFFVGLQFYPYPVSAYFLVPAILTGIAAFLFGMGLCAVGLDNRRPYGVSRWQVFRLLLAGLSRPEIRDYAEPMFSTGASVG